MCLPHPTPSPPIVILCKAFCVWLRGIVIAFFIFNVLILLIADIKIFIGEQMIFRRLTIISLFALH